MKITKVTPYPFFAGPKNLMLCRVDTDEGVYGWGEAYGRHLASADRKAASV